MTTTPKPRRRWFQFRLRTLFVLMLLASIALSWFAVKMQQARRQREAVRAIEAAGGMAWYDYERGCTSVAKISLCREPGGPAWLRELLGDDFIAAPVAAQVGNDDALRHLEELTQLEVLLLNGDGVSDAGLKSIRGLTRLHYLSIRSAKITDDGLDCVKALPDVRELWLKGSTQITDGGLERLRGMTQLEVLALGGTRITDTGLRHLNGMANLRYLEFYGTQVSDEGVRNLQELLPQCQIIHHLETPTVLISTPLNKSPDPRRALPAVFGGRPQPPD